MMEVVLYGLVTIIVNFCVTKTRQGVTSYLHNMNHMCEIAFKFEICTKARAVVRLVSNFDFYSRVLV